MGAGEFFLKGGAGSKRGGPSKKGGADTFLTNIFFMCHFRHLFFRNARYFEKIFACGALFLNFNK